MADMELRKKAMASLMKEGPSIEIKKKPATVEESEGEEKGAMKPLMVTEEEKQMILDMRKEESGESKEEEDSEQTEEE